MTWPRAGRIPGPRRARRPRGPSPPPGQAPAAARPGSGTLGTPSMSATCGFTACRVPVKPASRMLSRMDRPDRAGPVARADHRDRARRATAVPGWPRRPAAPGPPPRPGTALGSPSAALRGIGMLSSMTPSSIRRVTVSPASANTRSIAMFPGRVEAVKTPHPALAGQRDQVLEQQGGDAPAVHPVRHRERDLRGLGVGRGRLVAGHPHQFVAQEAEQRPVEGLAAVRPVIPGHPARLLLGGPPAHAEETQVQVVRRHGLVQLLDGLVVTGACGPDGDRGAVRQQGIRAARFGERGQLCFLQFSAGKLVPAWPAAGGG